jgi:hypothetical protein
LDAAVPVSPTTGTYGGIDRFDLALLAFEVHHCWCCADRSHGAERP